MFDWIKKGSFDADDFYEFSKGFFLIIVSISILLFIILCYKSYEHEYELEKYRIEYNIEKGEVKDE